MPTDIVSFCVFVGQAKPSKGVLDELCAATDVVQEASRVGEHARGSANDTRRNAPVCRCGHTGAHPVFYRRSGMTRANRHVNGYLIQAPYSACYSLRRAEGVPPISCVIFATHSSNAGATSFNNASRGA